MKNNTKICPICFNRMDGIKVEFVEADDDTQDLYLNEIGLGYSDIPCDSCRLSEEEEYDDDEIGLET